MESNRPTNQASREDESNKKKKKKRKKKGKKKEGDEKLKENGGQQEMVSELDDSLKSGEDTENKKLAILEPNLASEKDGATNEDDCGKECATDLLQLDSPNTKTIDIQLMNDDPLTATKGVMANKAFTDSVENEGLEVDIKMDFNEDGMTIASDDLKLEAPADQKNNDSEFFMDKENSHKWEKKDFTLTNASSMLFDDHYIKLKMEDSKTNAKMDLGIETESLPSVKASVEAIENKDKSDSMLAHEIAFISLNNDYDTTETMIQPDEDLTQCQVKSDETDKQSAGNLAEHSKSIADHDPKVEIGPTRLDDDSVDEYDKSTRKREDYAQFERAIEQYSTSEEIEAMSAEAAEKDADITKDIGDNNIDNIFITNLAFKEKESREAQELKNQVYTLNRASDSNKENVMTENNYQTEACKNVIVEDIKQDKNDKDSMVFKLEDIDNLDKDIRKLEANKSADDSLEDNIDTQAIKKPNNKGYSLETDINDYSNNTEFGYETETLPSVKAIIAEFEIKDKEKVNIHHQICGEIFKEGNVKSEVDSVQEYTEFPETKRVENEPLGTLANQQLEISNKYVGDAARPEDYITEDNIENQEEPINSQRESNEDCSQDAGDTGDDRNKGTEKAEIDNKDFDITGKTSIKKIFIQIKFTFPHTGKSSILHKYPPPPYSFRKISKQDVFSAVRGAVLKTYILSL